MDLDELMTPEKFARWRKVSVKWVRARLPVLPGAFKESRKSWAIHPRTYLDARLGKIKS